MSFGIVCLCIVRCSVGEDDIDENEICISSSVGCDMHIIDRWSVLLFLSSQQITKMRPYECIDLVFVLINLFVRNESSSPALVLISFPSIHIISNSFSVCARILLYYSTTFSWCSLEYVIIQKWLTSILPGASR